MVRAESGRRERRGCAAGPPGWYPARGRPAGALPAGDCRYRRRAAVGRLGSAPAGWWAPLSCLLGGPLGLRPFEAALQCLRFLGEAGIGRAQQVGVDAAIVLDRADATGGEAH